MPELEGDGADLQPNAIAGGGHEASGRRACSASRETFSWYVSDNDHRLLCSTSTR
jgi:hypothetical protein